MDLYDALEREFSQRWRGYEAHRHANAVLGGHAFRDLSAIHPAGRHRIVAIDGEWALYRAAEKWLPDQPQRIFRFRSAALEGSASCVGNITLLDTKEDTVHLAVDSTGTFPLYYAEHGGGLLFSSLLRPLAKVISASRDDFATLQFLRQAYTLMGRTPFRGISRLLPGQSLRYRPGDGLEIHEPNHAWTGWDNLTTADAAEAAWSKLLDILRAGLPSELPNALMMSAGWDSRTLLAGLTAVGLAQRLMCYSHGDIASRELRIVEQTCRSAGVHFRLEPIDDDILDLKRLQHGFDKVENVVFPHWHRAGVLLRDIGISCATAGVYGEVLGGHYGPAMVGSNRRRAANLARLLLRRDNALYGAAPRTQAVRDQLRVTQLDRHWYLNADFEAAIPDPQEQLNAEIDRALSRLEARGFTDPAVLLERFIAEHRGTQYINAQLLSCRSAIDIALPFAADDLLAFATCLPLPAKFHNRLNQRILRQYAPSLLRYPLAATLLPAAAPIAAQEASRLVRKVYGRTRSRLHQATGGRLRPPRLAWVNFDFLRKGQALRRVVDDLRSDIWDRDALERRIAAVQSGDWKGSLHPVFDQLLKVYTVDLLLR